MELISVDRELCRRDGICIEACPNKCIAVDAEGYPVAADGAACIACGHCVAVCPHGALDNVRAPMIGHTPVARERAGFAALSGLMKARRSVREFKPAPVPRETLAQLLDVARVAPTARHTQQVGYIVVSDPERVRDLAAKTADWLRQSPTGGRYARLWDAGHDVVLRGAPQVLLALCDADSGWGLTDAAIALSYLELAAASLGVGVCWAGLLHRALNHLPELSQSLGVPEGRTVCGALMLGLPKYRYMLVPPRKPADVAWL
jgi:nitroreductase/NAD-dependent dihydropyrimidine dehydrogenase PreA subunit